MTGRGSVQGDEGALANWEGSPQVTLIMLVLSRMGVLLHREAWFY